MASKKPAAKSTKGTKTSKAAATGPLPPYGVAIRGAISRGDSQEMKKAATSGRKYLKDLQTALAALEKAIGKGK